MVCPKCQSQNVTCIPVTTSNTKTNSNVKGFGCVKSCLGFLIFNIPGLLCGMCGMNKGKTTSSTTTKVETVSVCQNCGHRF